MHKEIDVYMQDLEVYFSNLTIESLDKLDYFYASDARFKDPFNEVQGCIKIKAIFEHMFKTLNSPRFVVTQKLFDNDQAFMCWDFIFSTNAAPNNLFLVKGSTHLFFCKDANGQIKIKNHRDYWDPAQEIYEKIPLLGVFFKWLRFKSSTPIK